MESETPSGAYSEAKMNAAFRRARNEIRKYHPLDVVFLSMDKLNRPRDVDLLRHYPPWFLLLLIKWAFQYGNYMPWAEGKLTPPGFNKLVNLVHKFDDAGRTPRDYSDLLLFFQAHRSLLTTFS